MRKEIKNIEPKIGLGELQFGMKQDDIKYLIGLPNEIEIYEYLPETKERHEQWSYYELQLEIYFSSEEEWKFDSVSVNSSYYELWKTIKIGQKMKNVEQILKKLKVEDYLCEDISTIESPDHKLFELKESDVNLWFDNRELSEIQWSPKFIDEETLNWPFKSVIKNEKAQIGYKRYSTDFLFRRLEEHLIEWLDKIFSNKEKYKDLINDFPNGTQRENLRTENRTVRYFLNIKEKIDGAIMAKARLLHNEIGDLGWMAVEWENDLTFIDDYILID